MKASFYSDHRLLAADALRGLLMILMALDHTAFFVAKIHPNETWVLPLPDYPGALAFLTRYVTHLCAPGFSLLLGMGMTLFHVNRSEQGWSQELIARRLAIRGVALILLEQLLDNPAWFLAETLAQTPIQHYRPVSTNMGMGSEAWLGFGVLLELGFSCLFWAALLRLTSGWVFGISLTVIGLSYGLTEILPPNPTLSSVWLLLFVSGHFGIVACGYPPLPWIGICGIGILCGRLLSAKPVQAYSWLAWIGGGLTSFFLLLRLNGIGDIHPTAFTDWIDFLRVTKYPPSLAFVSMSVGVNLILLKLLQRFQTWLSQANPLLVFGRTALFFYFAHTGLYLLIGLAFPQGIALEQVYLIWLLGLIVLYPVCRLFIGFKSNKPSSSWWRIF